jgi:hypothetical protein
MSTGTIMPFGKWSKADGPTFCCGDRGGGGGGGGGANFGADSFAFCWWRGGFMSSSALTGGGVWKSFCSARICSSCSGRV